MVANGILHYVIDKQFIDDVNMDIASSLYSIKVSFFISEDSLKEELEKQLIPRVKDSYKKAIIRGIEQWQVDDNHYGSFKTLMKFVNAICDKMQNGWK